MMEKNHYFVSKMVIIKKKLLFMQTEDPVFFNLKCKFIYEIYDQLHANSMKRLLEDLLAPSMKPK